MSKRVTLQTIADAANVHISTVSLALRNSPKISEETRRSIFKIAESLNYRPDPALSALISYRSSLKPTRYQETIAWLNCLPESKAWQKYSTLSGFRRGAERRAEELGYRIEEYWYFDPNNNPRRIIDIMKARNIRGMLLSAQIGLGSSIQIQWDDFCTVQIGDGLRSVRHDLVNLNQERTCAAAISKMAAKGYQRIGLILSQAHENAVRYQYAGAYLAATEIEKISQKLPILHAEVDNINAIVAWFTKYKPDALITMPYYPLQKLIDENEMIAKTPICLICSSEEDLKKIKGGHSNVFRVLNPSEMVGEGAVNMLDRRLRQNELGLPKHPFRLLYEGEWTNEIAKANSAVVKGTE